MVGAQRERGTVVISPEPATVPILSDRRFSDDRDTPRPSHTPEIVAGL
jgi:hypothetical protein